MEKTMKAREEKKDFLFEFTKSLTDSSQRGNLYGRLLELKDLQLHIQKRVNELEKQIEETDPLKQQKGAKMKIGDRVKIKDQDIFGKIIYDHGTEVVIEDEDAETEDNQLCFKKSEIERSKDEE